jgi:hypothetical protein
MFVESLTPLQYVETNSRARIVLQSATSPYHLAGANEWDRDIQLLPRAFSRVNDVITKERAAKETSSEESQYILASRRGSLDDSSVSHERKHSNNRKMILARC